MSNCVMKKKIYRNRFSDLPQEVTCEILGYLDIQDLARASTLSKEFNKLCTLLPRMCVNSGKIGDDPNKREKFLEFLRSYSEKVFQENSLGCVELRWRFTKNYADRERRHLETWLKAATASDNIKEIYIYLSTNIGWLLRPFKLPPRVFQRGRTLEKLTVRGSRPHVINFSPTSTNFHGLRFLNLSSVQVVEEDLFQKWLSESCRNLQELVLEDVVGVKNLCIVCPSLQKLKIERNRFDNITFVSESLKTLKLYIRWNTKNGTKSLRILAPNLNYLVMEGDLADNYYLDNFKFLQVASLYFQTFPWCMFDEKKPKEVIGRSIHKLLECVGEAKTLRVAEKLLEILDDYKKLQLVGVQDLFVDARIANSQTMASYLGRFPNLQFLSIRSFLEKSLIDIEFKRLEENSRYSEKYLKSQELDFFHQIKTLHIGLHKRDMMKLGSFVKYLLKCAAVLDEITIYYSPQEFPQQSEIAREFIDDQQHCSTRLILEPTSYMFINRDSYHYRMKKIV